MITFVISFYKNYTNYTPSVAFTTNPLNNLESRVGALEGTFLPLIHSRDSMLGVREFIRETKEAFLINTSAFHQLRVRVDNLYKYLSGNSSISPNFVDIPQLDPDNIFGPPINSSFPGLGHTLGGRPSVRVLAGENLPLLFD